MPQINLRQWNGKIKDEEGFTLIEIVLAVCVFSIGLLAVCTMLTTGVNATTNARCRTAATVWASDRVEKLLALDYDDPTLNDGTVGNETEGDYDVTWTVEEDELVENTKSINVTVAWSDIGLDRQITFTYYKSKF